MHNTRNTDAVVHEKDARCFGHCNKANTFVDRDLVIHTVVVFVDQDSVIRTACWAL